MRPVIEVRRLEKSFGEIQAIRDVSFTAEDGHITGLLGPNGAGKSTTLRVLYGLLRQNSGTASIDGISIKERPRDAQKRMGVLPDTLGLYVHLTAREHIQYFGRLQGMEEIILNRRTNELIELLKMQDIADRRSEGFSHGQKMKVCLARALVHDPANVLLDEPTNGLDVRTTRTVRELITRLRNEGKSVLFSSHQMHEVARLCDHIVIISNGLVVASGTADQIRETAGKDDLEDAFINLVERVIGP